MRLLKIILISILSTASFNTVFACSPGPVPKLSPLDSVNRYKNATSAVMVKVIEVNRDQHEIDKLKKQIAVDNTLTKSKITKLKTILKKLESENNYTPEIKNVWIENKKLDNKRGEISSKLYDVNLSFQSELYKGSDESVEIMKLKINRQSLIEKIIENKENILANESKIKILQLKSYYHRDSTKGLANKIKGIERKRPRSITREYTGPIEVKMKVIESYKGIYPAGKIITTKLKERGYSFCGEPILDNFLYRTSVDNMAVLYFNSSDRDKYMLETEDSTDFIISKTMLAIKGGSYRDKIADHQEKFHTVEMITGSSKQAAVNNPNKKSKGLSVKIKKTTKRTISTISKTYNQDVKIVAFFKDGTSQKLADYKEHH